jgi:hypothetical protein
MSTIKATATLLDARTLEAKGQVQAIVRDQSAIVFAQACQPISQDPEIAPYSITARAVQTGTQDKEADATPLADPATQELIDRMDWEPWPQ